MEDPLINKEIYSKTYYIGEINIFFKLDEILLNKKLNLKINMYLRIFWNEMK